MKITWFSKAKILVRKMALLYVFANLFDVLLHRGQLILKPTSVFWLCSLRNTPLCAYERPKMQITS